MTKATRKTASSRSQVADGDRRRYVAEAEVVAVEVAEVRACAEVTKVDHPAEHDSAAGARIDATWVMSGGVQATQWNRSVYLAPLSRTAECRRN